MDCTHSSRDTAEDLTMQCGKSGQLAAAMLVTTAIGVLAFGSSAVAQQAQRDAIHLPNGTRYTYCNMRGCYDGVILDQPNGEVCEGVGLREFLRQRFFCHK